MFRTDPRRPRTVPEPTGAARSARTGGLARRLAAGLVVILAAGAALLALGGPAQALPRGEVMPLPGGLLFSNFVLPNGKRAYCIEVAMPEPTGQITESGRLGFLPGRAGAFSAYSDAAGIRQMNYLIDQHGQNGNPWSAAGVQLSIWRIREGGGNAALNQKMSTLRGSVEGRGLIQFSDDLIAEAKRLAVAPQAPKANTGKLQLAEEQGGAKRRYRVSYPAGTRSLSVTGGVFVQNGAQKLSVSGDGAGTALVDAAAGAKKLEVVGSWSASGKRGWDALLDIYAGKTSGGSVAQSVAVATGSSVQKDLSGSYPAVSVVPRQELPPTAASLAQPSAELGGTMSDVLIITPQANSELKMWPEAEAEFTAYLMPEAGEQKVDAEWQPILGEPFEAQAEDPVTGAPLWREWWAAADGTPLLDAAGERIPTLSEDGLASSGIAADGTPYPVQLLAEDGTPAVDETGAPLHATVREPVLEQRREPLLWDEAELAAMTAEARCTAQPVFHQTAIPVPGAGRYASEPVPVRTSGTVHWVERVRSRGAVVHEGKCGLSNETTRIGEPGVTTRALPEALIGEELYDIAIVSGALAAGAEYTVRFEAYRAPEALPADGEPVEPSCTAGNIVFRSDPVPVTAPGEVRSPGFTARWEHGTTVWWVETLLVDTGEGPRILHRGECGLEHETTRIGRPAVETSALETAAIGDRIIDVARVSGEIASNDAARWELTFTGYRERFEPVVGLGGVPIEAEEGGEPGGSGSEPGVLPAVAPVCDAQNLLFETGATPVPGPGEFRSEEVVARPDWRGSIWWVETLWLIEGELRIPVSKGACGLENETTRLEGPEVLTDASEFVALGDHMRDTASVTGTLSARDGVRHEVVFEGFRGDPALTGTEAAACTAENRLFITEPVPVEGPGPVESPEVTALPRHGETVWWVETLVLRDGEDSVELHRGECGLANETTTVQLPEVRTESAGSVRVGEELFDTAIVTGALSDREDVTFRVTFAAYRREDGEAMVCTPERALRELGDPEGVAVDGPGRYESRRVRAEQRHAGLGGYVETLLMAVDGQEHVVHVGECGARGENFEVRARAELSRTGGPPVWPLAVAAAGLLTGGVLLGMWERRRRGRRVRVRECRDLVGSPE